MQKEKLRQEHIIVDLCKNEELRYNRSQYWLTAGIACVAFAILFSVIWSIWVGLVIGLIAALLMGSEVRNYLHHRKLLRSIRTGQYSVTSEILTGCNEEDIRNSNSVYRKQPRYVLRFGSEVYCIPEFSYPWSHNYQMSYDGMVNTSVIGNEFWVIRINETQEIGAVYNKKFFEFMPRNSDDVNAPPEISADDTKIENGS